MTQRQFRFTLAVGILSILFLLVWLLFPDVVQPPVPQPAYTLCSDNGKLALYSAEGDAPMAVYEDIYVRLLPEIDQLALQNGVPVEDDAQLEQLLEDYGR